MLARLFVRSAQPTEGNIVPNSNEVADEDIQQEAAEVVAHLRTLMGKIAINEILRMRHEERQDPPGGLE
jgi:hypothetical protein